MSFWLTVLIVLLIVWAIAARLKRYLHNGGHFLLRLALAVCCLEITLLFVGGAWGYGQPGSPNASFGEAIATGMAQVCCFLGGVLFAGLAIVLFAPVARRDHSVVRKQTPSRLEVALSIILIVFPSLSLVALTIMLFNPQAIAIALSKTDHPLEWVKITSTPGTLTLSGRLLRQQETTLHVQSASGQWKRAINAETNGWPQVAVLSPDSVLVTLAPPGTNGRHPYVGIVFRRGVEGPAASIPQSDDIFPVGSGGFIAARYEPRRGCGPAFMKLDDGFMETKCERRPEDHPDFFTIETYNSLGERTDLSNVNIPDELTYCEWGRKPEGLLDDSTVYRARACNPHSHSGLYLVSRNGLRQIARDKGNGKGFEDALPPIKEPKWYHGHWDEDHYRGPRPVHP